MTGTTPRGAAVDAAPTLEELVRPVLGPAYNFALRLTRDETNAEDLLQEAASRACQFFHQFQPGTNFRAWFFKIVANCFYTGVRRERRRGAEVDVEDTPPLYLYMRTIEAGLHSRGDDPATALLDRLGTERITAALERLPDEYRAVAALYFLEDLRYDEIADALGIPVGTVRSRLHRGRRILQRQLWDLAQDHGLVPAHRGAAT